MKNSFQKVSLSVLAWALPVIAFAQSESLGILGALGTLQRIINSIIPVVITFGLLFFLYGVVTYILDPKDVGKARDIMLYGIIGLFVMVSVWGLVNLLSDTFLSGSTRAAPTTMPFVPVPPGR